MSRVITGEEEEEEEIPESKGSVVYGEDVEEEEEEIKPVQKEETVSTSSDSPMVTHKIIPTGPGKKIYDRNENVRKVLAKKVYGLYLQTGENLKTLSSNLNTNLNLMQDAAQDLSDINEQLSTLSKTLPFSFNWVQSGQWHSAPSK
eukprot:TRINITY_DN10867_c0_g1_i1.p1 TRINITY_DN10867_c0_g1~~TRINITY_DN10867_c0_g1_i1.p1  ORF type:complete len:162 (-),score=60.41 TRINITY_DN10867_c0_g1_i1:88-525(-)